MGVLCPGLRVKLWEREAGMRDNGASSEDFLFRPGVTPKLSGVKMLAEGKVRMTFGDWA